MELSSLKPLFDRPGPWASVYLDTARETEDGRRLFELRTRAVSDQLASLGADERTRQAVVRALRREPVSGTPPGRALFAKDGEVVAELPLNRSPALVDTHWSTLPHLGPLVDLIGDEPRLLVAHVDRRGARFELRTSLGHEPLGESRGERFPVHRTGRADWSSKHYDYKVEDRWDRTARTVAERVNELCGEADADLVVLAGDPRERRAVHDRLDELLPDALETGPEPRPEELDDLRRHWRQSRLATALDRFWAGRHLPAEEQRRPGMGPGAAAEGIRAVVLAARRRQLETLLVRPDALDGEAELWIGPDPEHVGLRPDEVEEMGVERPEPVDARDALLRSVTASDAEVLVLPDDATAPADGIGAVLRWTDRSR
ncbi:hypothetical protein AQ490_20205 [Wenjunlia vitaminophila]|uniref:Peptide chain release factor 1 n=1 Tax=Wenjunlia vitaminophila TaxID=76728 RepID=A0A0T6LU04_WENVI|nr:Vms1/Ankzf1 family peptidyl-tRNA hydrolase [Wenjunlia vitaminophila]KRV49639.1 hypothetical protein AQ490_20205 [Wenjunlia vitaminophila]